MDILDDDSARHVTRTSVLHAADWFFWLAILSVINSLLVFYYQIPNTPIALGLTQWVDGTTSGFNATMSSGCSYYEYSDRRSACRVWPHGPPRKRYCICSRNIPLCDRRIFGDRVARRFWVWRPPCGPLLSSQGIAGESPYPGKCRIDLAKARPPTDRERQL